MTEPAGDSTINWRPWFAWYPVRIYGYADGCLWRPPRWTWLRRVEWADTQYIGCYLYRPPENDDV